MVVQSGVYEEVVGRMKNVLGGIKVGAPLEDVVDMSAITMKTQVYI
jgi:acyl-CoA reductase-like NAD-dependent aldehyde dehydrogenase